MGRGTGRHQQEAGTRRIANPEERIAKGLLVIPPIVGRDSGICKEDAASKKKPRAKDHERRTKEPVSQNYHIKYTVASRNETVDTGETS